MKFLNVVIERKVKLMEEFEDVLTDDKEQRKLVTLYVEDRGKHYYDSRKSTLAEYFLTVIVLFFTVPAMLVMLKSLSLWDME